jgi:hypothetical protein
MTGIIASASGAESDITVVQFTKVLVWIVLQYGFCSQSNFVVNYIREY